MSIASELNNYRNGLEDAYDAAQDMGATIPTDRNMINLDDAIRTIPVSSPNDGVLTIQQNGTTVGTFSADQATNTTANITPMTGATSSVAGAAGLVPAPTASDPDKYLKGDGTWGEASPKFTVMEYGESNAWTKFINAYRNNSVIYCRCSTNNTNPASGTKGRSVPMTYLDNPTNPTYVEFQYYRAIASHTSSQQTDQIIVYKLSNNSTWSVTARDTNCKIAVNNTMTMSVSSNTINLAAKNMTGATSSAAGAAGYAPAPAAGDNEKFLRGDGTWQSLAPTMFYWHEDQISGDGNLYTDADYTTVADAYDVKEAFDTTGAKVRGDSLMTIDGVHNIISRDSIGFTFAFIDSGMDFHQLDYNGVDSWSLH